MKLKCPRRDRRPPFVFPPSPLGPGVLIVDVEEHHYRLEYFLFSRQLLIAILNNRIVHFSSLVKNSFTFPIEELTNTMPYPEPQNAPGVWITSLEPLL